MTSTPSTPSDIKNTPTTHQTLKFLDSAAHLLAPTCNTISSHLSRQVADVSFESSLRSSKSMTKDMRRDFEVCASCGTIAVQGITVTSIGESDDLVRLIKDGAGEPGKTRRKKPYLAKGPTGPKISKTKCLVCGTVTEAKILRYDRKISKFGQEESKSNVLESSQAEETASSTQAGRIITRSQRRKESKKDKSLQAMLRKSKENEKDAKSGFGLGLMDLMMGGD
jgi:hypothetical protein